MNKILYRSEIELYIYIFFISISFLSIFMGMDIVLIINLGLLLTITSFFLLKHQYFLLFLGILISLLHSSISYVISGAYIMFYIYILMLICLFMKGKKIQVDKVVLSICFVSLFLSFAPLIVNGTSIPLLVISILKKYGFIIVYIFTMNLESVTKKQQTLIMKAIVVFLVINFFISLFQFSTGAYHQDYITGLLGYGMSGILIYLFMMYLGIISSWHYKKKINFISYLLLILIILFYSAIAEVKIGFVVTVVLLIIYFLFINRNFKSLFSIAIIFTILINVYSLFISFYPNNDFLNRDFLQNYLVEQDYGNNGAINRLNFITKINAEIISNNTEKMFGMGLGSGNVSNLEILNGSLVEEYDYLKFRWFTLPLLYVETGYIGLILYTSIYLITLVISIKHFIKYKSALSVTALLMSLSNILFLPYNSGLLDFGVTTVFWTFIAFLRIEKKEFEIKKEL